MGMGSKDTSVTATWNLSYPAAIPHLINIQPITAELHSINDEYVGCEGDTAT